MWSLARTLGTLRPWVPRRLVSERALARTASVAARLPAALTDCIYFESWLGREAGRADLILRVDAERRTLLSTFSPALFDPSLGADPRWPRLVAFAREWASPGSRFHAAVEALWLEFDLPAAADPTAVPSPRVFVDFTPEVYREPAVAPRVELARAALAALSGGVPDSGVMDALGACFESLPPGSFVPYVGLSASGDAPTFRVCVQGLGERLASYLTALRWPGDPSDLERSVLAPLGEARGGGSPGVTIVHLDLRPHLAPRIGLEYPFARASQWQGRLEETALLDHLVARGWCRAAARDGLVAWPGRSVELLAHEIWPSQVGRRLSHVKVTYATGERTQVKAYLCFLFEPAAGSTLIGTRPFVPSNAGARRPSAIE